MASPAYETIAQRRLQAQGLIGSSFADPTNAVRALLAVQAQDVGAAKWAIAQRTGNTSDADVERALASGSILRTHVLRPTWHFVTPADIKWLLALTAPRVHRLNAYQYRATGVDLVPSERCTATLTAALQGGRELTRIELVAALRQSGIALASLLGYTMLLMRAELDAVICSGALKGKQQTYALLEERAPQARGLEREEALAEVVVRYFAGHAPATVKDFVWWSGLTVSDAKLGLELAGSRLARERIDGEMYWFTPAEAVAPVVSSVAHLLPNFDEYTVGYADRQAVIAVARQHGRDLDPFTILGNTIILNGQIVGAWKKSLSARDALLELDNFVPFDETQQSALASAVARYSAFIGRPVRCSWRE